jgi:hypothetical protein
MPMRLTLLQMNFVLGASSMDRVFRVILAAVAIQCTYIDLMDVLIIICSKNYAQHILYIHTVSTVAP